LVVVYTLVLLSISEQPLQLRLLGAVSLVLLFWLWIRIHQGDVDVMWTSVFEGLALITIGVGVGDVLLITAIFYNGLYFRSLRGGMSRAIARSSLYNLAYLAVLFLLPATVDFSRIDLFISMTFAFPLVAATMSLLGAGLRQSDHYQEQLREARDTARTNHQRLVEAERVAKVGSWEWVMDGDVASYSDGYLAVAGRNEIEATFEGLLSIVHPEDRYRVSRAIGQARKQVDGINEVEARIVLPNGDIRVTLSRVRAVTDPEGRTSGLMGTIQDITELQTLRSELASQQEISEMKSRFLSTVSHELRTPLTAVIGFTEAMLAEDHDLVSRNEFLGLIQEQGLELSTLIEDLITFGRAEAGELTIDSVVVDLDREVGKVLAGLAPRGSSILVEIEQGAVVRGDPLRVRQIVRNLLDNALKYGTSPIRVTAFRRDSEVVCRVSDEGPGIGQESVDIVFEPYRRLIDDDTMGLPGVGLGLPLSRLLAEQQNGTLRYVDTGSGATFELTLPVAVPDTDLAKKAALNPGLVGGSRTPTRKPMGASARLLT
jgi:PAS domain S-box-containing protein